MARHGVIASIQPQFVHSDAAWLASKLPQQLMRLAYPWKSLRQAGIIITMRWYILCSFCHTSN